MTSGLLFLSILILSVAGFVIGRSRVLRKSTNGTRGLHSLPIYYGTYVALITAIPSLVVLLLWMVLQPLIIGSMVQSGIPLTAVPEGGSLGLVMSDVVRVANGLDVVVSSGSLTTAQALDPTRIDTLREVLAQNGVALGADIKPEILIAAQEYRADVSNAVTYRMIIVLVAAFAGLVYGLMRVAPDFRARNSVEATVRMILVAAASLAVLTTVGIVLSLLFNTIEFFRIYPASDFFLSLIWQPSFQDNSFLGVWPLIWGTLYISFIALCVAVPIGLFAAIYLSEYAGPKMRGVAKPLLEVLAGIPTIVYGLFALLTVGPLLVSIFGNNGTLGVDWMAGGTAVMTAGLVMGIMLIPFVSSLSDDIINAVPQAMRDGSLGLGATKSETIRKVVVPAALPGIVGAILLAASRAIGETMIVVLGAGAAARLSMNPFEAMTTVTAKIVSQLTGDADFASPEALVAFALGMTLFIMTLGLNVLALYIVRKYREQYE